MHLILSECCHPQYEHTLDRHCCHHHHHLSLCFLIHYCPYLYLVVTFMLKFLGGKWEKVESLVLTNCEVGSVTPIEPPFFIWMCGTKSLLGQPSILLSRQQWRRITHQQIMRRLSQLVFLTCIQDTKLFKCSNTWLPIENIYTERLKYYMHQHIWIQNESLWEVGVVMQPP